MEKVSRLYQDEKIFGGRNYEISSLYKNLVQRAKEEKTLHFEDIVNKVDETYRHACFDESGIQVTLELLYCGNIPWILRSHFESKEKSTSDLVKKIETIAENFPFIYPPGTIIGNDFHSK